MATVVAESLVGASEDAARRQAKRREKAGNLDFEIEMSDGLTKAQADEARLLMGYPSAAAAAVQAADFDLAQEHNFGFLRGTASFLRTRDLTRAASATLDEALESAHLAGSMLSAFTSRRETTVSRIQQRIQSAAGHVRWVAQNLNEDTYATAARTFEQTNPSATADEKAKHRREQGIVSREQEAVLRDWYGPELAAADRSIDVSYATPDLTDIHRICTDQAGSLARFAEGLPPKAAGMIRTAVGELRQAGGMLAVLINPRRAAQALRGILIECRGSVDRMIALPRRHDPTMPPGPENPPPHRFRPRGLEAEPSPAPIEISPL